MTASGTSPAPQTTAPANQNWAAWLHSPQGYATTIVALLLIVFVIPAVMRGGKREDPAALKEIERMKAEANQKRGEYERQLAQQKQFELLIAQQKAQEDRHREDMRNLLNTIKDQRLRDEAQEKYNEKQRQLEEERRANELKFQQLQQQIQEAKKAADTAKQNAQTVQPQVVVYPPYHPYYYRWW